MKIRNIFLVLLLVAGFSDVVLSQGMAPPENSEAYRRYQMHPQTELSKLVYLMDRFNVSGVEIKVDGGTFNAAKAFPYWKICLKVSYDGESAEEWVRRYCYRSDETNQVIYISVDHGGYEPVRDVFIRELKNLRLLSQ